MRLLTYALEQRLPGPFSFFYRGASSHLARLSGPRREAYYSCSRPFGYSIVPGI